MQDKDIYYVELEKLDTGKFEDNWDDLELAMEDVGVLDVDTGESFADLYMGNGSNSSIFVEIGKKLAKHNKEAYNFIILEVPAISVNAIPNQLIKNSKLSLLMLDSRRPWASSDKYMLNLFQKATDNSNKIMVWLNYVAPENLVSVVGEAPRKSVGSVKSALVKA
jgi:hypothetical protein